MNFYLVLNFFSDNFPGGIFKSLIENVFYNVKKHEQFSKFFCSRFEHEIEFISGHFFEIDKKDLIKLPIDFIEAILRNEEALKLEDEDSLVEFIRK